MEQHIATVPSSTTAAAIDQSSTSVSNPITTPSVISTSSQSVSNGANSAEETKIESSIPIQAPLESLSLNKSSQSSTDSKISQQSNHADDQVEDGSAVLADNELSLLGDGNARGM